MLPDVIDFDDVDFAAYGQDYDDDEWDNHLAGASEPGLNLQQLQRLSMAHNIAKNKGIFFLICRVLLCFYFVYCIEYDSRITGIGTHESGSGIQVVSKAQFRQSISKLREERKSMEIAARRYTIILFRPPFGSL